MIRNDTRAAFASTVITPPIGTHMSGYPDVRLDLSWAPDAMKGYVGRRQLPSTGTHDPLLATVFALEVDGVRAVLIGVDTLVVTAPFTRHIRESLLADGVAPQNVLVAASHTHAGPDLFAWWEGDPSATLAERAAELTIAAAKEALGRLEEADLAYAVGSLDYGSVNRRAATTGPIDPGVAVVRVSSASSGRVIGLIVNFACHPVTLDYANYQFSADYVWALRETLAAVYPRSETVFLNGAAGNINPARYPYEQRANIYVPQTLENRPVYWGGFDAAARLGRTVAGEAIKASERALRLDLRPPAGRTVALRLPLKHGEQLEQYLDFMRFSSEDYRRSLSEATELESDVQVIDLGGLRVCGLPGEIFVEIGLNIRAAAGPGNLLLVGFANDDVRYVMTDDAYVAGQYETVGTPLDSGSAEAMTAAARLALATG
jgi:neutral ceramidase